MLTFESEQFCIPAEESEILEVYRSSATVRLPAEGKPAHPFQAFVCVLKGEREGQAFAALHAKELKRPLVYAVDREAGGKPSPETLLETAFAFTEALGFAMEAVNLQYGAAMREVVLKTIPVLLPPETAEQVRQERAAQLAEWEMAITAHQADEQHQQNDAELSADERMAQQTARRERAAAAEAAAKRLAAEQRNDEQAETVRQEVENILAQMSGPEATDAEQRRLTAEAEAAHKRAADLEQTARRLETQVETVRSEAEKRIAGLEKALGEAQAQAESAGAEQKKIEKAKVFNEKRRIELEKELAKAWQELEAGHAERKALLGEKEAAEKRLAELEEAAQEAKALSNTEGAEPKRLETARLEVERRLAELQEEHQRVRKEVEIGAAERARLAEEKTSAEKRSAELEAMLGKARKDADSGASERNAMLEGQASAQKRIAELEDELNNVQKRARAAELTRVKMAEGQEEVKERVAVLEAALQAAREETETERLEKERQRREKTAAEQRILQLEKAIEQAPSGAGGANLSAAGADGIDKNRMAELQKALRQAEERAEFLRLELERMAAAKVAVEQRMNELESAGGTAKKQPTETRRESLSPVADRKDGPAASPSKRKAGPPPHVVRRPPPPGAFFHVDWDLTNIEYASPEDILEAYQPLGMLQLSIEGYPNQQCSAYVVTMKQEKTRQVYVAFCLAESERTLIYVPAKPIQNKATYAEAVKEALKLLEVVGCMPDKIALGGSAQNRAKALNGIPFLNGPR